MPLTLDRAAVERTRGGPPTCAPSPLNAAQTGASPRMMGPKPRLTSSSRKFVCSKQLARCTLQLYFLV